jgi:hypothetical protein
MIHPLRQSLIVLVALLQLVAPLVHAHSSGMQSVALGVHLPGLEFIAATDNMPSAHAEAPRSDCCGILIAVSCGVQCAKTSIDMPAALHSHQEATIVGTDFIVAVINFSPQQPPVFSTQTVLQPISPRAPPSLPLSV